MLGSMSLNLIYGPPNSGRRGLVRAAFSAALGRDPVLVVPTVDDVFDFERELSSSSPALLGGSIVTFGGLFAEVARTAGEPPPDPLSEAQRIRLVTAAIERVGLGPLGSSARRPGFPRALDQLIKELQAAGLDPETVSAQASTLESSAYLGDLASLFAAYSELRDGHSYADAHTIARAAIAALRSSPDAWTGRPVLLYGFDDLTVEQRELIAALAAATDLTVSLTYEDRAALAARARLLEQLRELGPESETRTEPDPANTPSELLFRLERNFLLEQPELSAADDSLVLLRSAGSRGEAELIGAEIARLLKDGARPDEIAVALRDPARRGQLHAQVLRGFGIPVALEADLPVSGTASGTCLLALLHAAFGTQSAADLLAYLRGPSRAPSGQVDRFERRIRRGRLRSAAEAAEEWEQLTGEAPRNLVRLLDAGGDPARLLAATAYLARDIAQWPLSGKESRGTLPGHDEALELRAGEAIATAVEELAELGQLAPSSQELIGTLEALTMPAWSGPIEGRVRISSPYRLRAARFAHLFVGSLQDGEFPRYGSDGPFLSDEQRATLRLPERSETDTEERYLFEVCLSLPTERLYLSYRSSDEAGGGEAVSPFVGEVRRLLDPPPPSEGEDRLEKGLLRSRGLGDVLFEPALAPSEPELARALAARQGEDAAPALAALAVTGPRAERIEAALRAASLTEERTRAPGPLQLEAVKQELAAVQAYGGTTLENFEECSYRWFVGHELNPQSLDPEPEPLAQGSLMHKALELLYRESPGDDALPRPGDAERWIARGREIVADLGEKLSGHPADRAMCRRVERLVVAFVRREAGRENPRVRPTLFEAKFGTDEDAQKPVFEINGWGLHGAIDRVDEGDGIALVHDYKVSREVTPLAKFVEEGKLQLPLYLLALRDLWQIDAAAGLYQPLRATTNPRPRGLIREDLRDALADLELYGNDMLDGEQFEAALAEAAERAGAVVARMRSGDIRRDPGPPPPFKTHNQCPRFCTYAPICRRERAPVFIPEDEEDEEVAA
jgi:ATP-dependent helicase/DNAse subunit B